MQVSLITQVQSLEARGGWKTELNLTVIDMLERVCASSHINDLKPLSDTVKLPEVLQWVHYRNKPRAEALDLKVTAGAFADLTVHLDSEGLIIFSYSRAMSVTRL